MSAVVPNGPTWFEVDILKILVIDDDIIARMALAEVIRSVSDRVGQVVEFQSGNDAWSELEQSFVLPFMVFCDIRMPGMSGIDLLQVVKKNERMKDLPFVMISSAGDMETIKTALAIGIAGFVVKPYSFDDACLRLKKFISVAREKMAETPAQTRSRLKISAERYSHYLSGLRAQLSHLAVQAKASSMPHELDRVKHKIEALRTASQTLGLWRAISILENMMAAAATQDNLLDGLHEVNQLVQYQTYSVDV